MPGRPKAPKKVAVAKKKRSPAPSIKKTKTKTPKAKASAKAKAKAPVRVKRRAAAAPRVSKATKKPKKPQAAPQPRPSERALATSAQLPRERSLSDEERDAIAKVADTARRFLDAVGGPDAVVHRVAAFVDEVRGGKAPEPKSQDVRLGLGALWGEQLRAQVGWVWVHLTYPDGFASYALVPDDRAFACFPLNRVQELMSAAVRANTTVAIFNSIVAGTLPATRRPNAYLVIG